MWKSILARLGEQVTNEGIPNPTMLRQWLGLPADNEILAKHLILYKELVGIEWAIEKQRISRLASCSMLFFCSFFCLMFSVGMLVVVEFWATEHRYSSILGLVIVYAVLLIFAGFRLQASFAEGKNSFSALGTEISTDMDLVKRVLL